MTLLLLAALLQAKEPSATQVTLFTWDTYRFAADLDDGGDVSLVHSKVSFDLRQFLSRQDMVLLQTGVDFLRYDFSGDSALGTATGEPWEDVFIFRADLVYMHFFDARWSGLVYGSLYDSFEDGADKGDGVSFGAGVGVLYRSSPQFMIGAALRAVTRIEESPYVFVVPQIDWQFSPGWTLKTESRSPFTLTLSRDLGEPAHWAAEARTHYWLRRFRLDDDALVPEGIVQDDRVSVEVGVKWTPCESFWASLHVGADVWQEFTIEAKNGNDIGDTSTDPAPYLAVALSASF
jgi:hypothetical protein